MTSWMASLNENISIWPVNSKGHFAGVGRQGFKVPDVIRFWSRVELGERCWEWQGGKFPEGYGVFDGKLAHHWVARNYCKFPPSTRRMVVDHRCGNRACVRPSHLRYVSQRENIMNGRNHVAAMARQTHCKRGHPLSGDNLVQGCKYRSCKVCHNLRARLRKKEQVTTCQ